MKGRNLLRSLEDQGITVRYEYGYNWTMATPGGDDPALQAVLDTIFSSQPAESVLPPLLDGVGDSGAVGDEAQADGDAAPDESSDASASSDYSSSDEEGAEFVLGDDGVKDEGGAGGESGSSGARAHSASDMTYSSIQQHLRFMDHDSFAHYELLFRLLDVDAAQSAPWVGQEDQSPWFNFRLNENTYRAFFLRQAAGLKARQTHELAQRRLIGHGGGGGVVRGRFSGDGR